MTELALLNQPVNSKIPPALLPEFDLDMVFGMVAPVKQNIRVTPIAGDVTTLVEPAPQPPQALPLPNLGVDLSLFNADLAGPATSVPFPSGLASTAAPFDTMALPDFPVDSKVSLDGLLTWDFPSPAADLYSFTAVPSQPMHSPDLFSLPSESAGSPATITDDEFVASLMEVATPALTSQEAPSPIESPALSHSLPAALTPSSTASLSPSMPAASLGPSSPASSSEGPALTLETIRYEDYPEDVIICLKTGKVFTGSKMTPKPPAGSKPTGVRTRRREAAKPIVIVDSTNKAELDRANNTLAARRSRRRVRATTTYLSGENETLMSRNASLHNQLIEKNKKIEMLHSLLRSHGYTGSLP